MASVNILTWRQERAGATTQKYTFTSDLVDQLTSPVLTDTNTTPTILKRQAWAYDAAGNRAVDQTEAPCVLGSDSKRTVGRHALSPECYWSSEHDRRRCGCEHRRPLAIAASLETRIPMFAICRSRSLTPRRADAYSFEPSIVRP